MKSKSIEADEKYKNYKNLFEKLRKKAKKKYYSEIISKYKYDSKNTWRIMKEIIGKTKEKSNSLPQVIKVNGKNIYDQNVVAKEFNKFFINVGPNLAKKIEKSQTSFETYLTQSTLNLEFENLTFNEFEDAFKSLKRNRAMGTDDINGNVIIDVYDTIKNILFRVVKASIEQGIFPNDLKIAKVTPVFKSGDQTDVSNYRPISVLPVFSKVLERIMYNRIYKHLTSNKLLYRKQLGFQKNCSTEHAIMQFTRDILESFEKGEYTLGVFIDLSKAFDTVDHEILLKKLKYYGVKGINLNWLKSYLSNRKQYVHSDGVLKQLLNIKCGVPQGSILGPLLFLIYVNDFYKASNLLNEIMFADDTNLFLTHKNLNILFNSMNTELQEISSWFKSNKLSLNIDKTKWTIFHPTSKKEIITTKLTRFIY